MWLTTDVMSCCIYIKEIKNVTYIERNIYIYMNSLQIVH